MSSKTHAQLAKPAPSTTISARGALLPKRRTPVSAVDTDQDSYGQPNSRVAATSMRPGNAHHFGQISLHPSLQAKLTIGPPNDRFEQEADRVADHVMRTPPNATMGSTPGTVIQRQGDTEAETEEESIQAKPIAASITPWVQRQVNDTEEEEREEEEEQAPVQTKGLSVGLTLQRQTDTENEEEEEEPLQAKPIASTTPVIQRQTETEEDEEEETIQPKLVVQRQAEEEEDEKEAPVQTKAEMGLINARIQRQAEPEEEEEEEVPVQTKAGPDPSPAPFTGLEPLLHSMRGRGQPLPNSTRSFFEPRFGHDFSQVRVHADGQAARAAHSINAQAFTQGQDVFFGAGRYQPNTRQGQQLLAHELTHTVQQMGRRPLRMSGQTLVAGPRSQAPPARVQSLVQRQNAVPIAAPEPEPPVAPDEDLAEWIRERLVIDPEDRQQQVAQRLDKLPPNRREVTLSRLRAGLDPDERRTLAAITARVDATGRSSNQALLDEQPPLSEARVAPAPEADSTVAADRPAGAALAAVPRAVVASGEEDTEMPVAEEPAATGPEPEAEVVPVAEATAAPEPPSPPPPEVPPAAPEVVAPQAPAPEAKEEAPAPEAKEEAPAPEARLDTSSASGLLQSLAGVPPSATGQAVTQTRAATPEIQAREKTDLEASFPTVERPTGLPRLEDRPEPEPTVVPKGRVPTPKTPGSRKQAPPQTRHEEARGPLPGSQVSTTAPEPREDEGGSWWSWLINRVRRFINSLPAHDPGLSTSAGRRPRVDLSGDADPALAVSQQQSSDQEVGKKRTEADQNAMADFGENRIYPTEASAPRETLRPSYKPKPPTGSKVSKVGQTPPLPADTRAEIDQNAGPSLQSRVGEFQEEYGQGQETYRASSAEIRLDGQRRMADENAKTRKEQETLQQEARAEVTEGRESWLEENRKIQESYDRQSSTEHKALDKKIKDKARTSETEADRKLMEAENKAEAARRKADADAAAEKRKARNKPRSWWDRVKGAVSAALKAFKKVVNAIFDALRKAVRTIIEAAKAVVRGIIELARLAIVGFLKAFGEVLKGLVTVALAAFPEQAAKARAWIDDKVNTAVETVNAAAEKLKEATDAILDAIGEALDMALSLLQTAFNKIIDFFESLVLGLLELLQKLHELLTKFGAFLRGAKRIFENPEIIIDALKAALGELIAKIPAEAIAAARAAMTSSASLKEHWDGIWRHLQPKLEYLKNNWWDVIKQAGKELLWPWPGVWEDLKKIWTKLGHVVDNVWDGDVSKGIDNILEIWRLLNSVVGRLYGWFFIASVLIGAIIGAFFGGVGAIPGAAAGAAFAAKVGFALLASMIAAEAARIGKSAWDLSEGKQTSEENEEDYEHISESALILAITGVMFALGALAARFGRAIITRAARFAKGVVKFVLGPRAVAFLENALARIRAKIAEIWLRIRHRGKTKLKGSGVTKASYEGPARKLHPERFDEIIAELEKNGVDINVSRTGDPWKGSYQPGKPGKPGSIRVHRDVDLRTLEHEFKHFLDDRVKGYPGLRHYLENPNEMWELERIAYDHEISMVKADKTLTANDKAAIIKELEAQKLIEKERILGPGAK